MFLILFSQFLFFGHLIKLEIVGQLLKSLAKLNTDCLKRLKEKVLAFTQMNLHQSYVAMILRP